MNFALINYYEEIALDTVLKLSAEQGIKLRRGDFFMCEDEEERKKYKDYHHEFLRQNIYHKSRVESVWKDNYKTGIVYIHLYYNEGTLAQRVKAKVRNFLNYRYVTVYDEEVVFSFTKNELDIFAADSDNEIKADEDKIKSVMRKIAQLLKFTEERGATEGEAIAASAKVQMLLAKYHLSIEEVTGEKRDEKDIMEVTAFAGKGKKWKYNLAGAVADGYCCKVFYIGSDRIVFYGYEADILAARRIFIYLFDVGNKLGGQYERESRERYGEARGVFNSYVSGFVRGVRSEFEKNCTALALVVQPEVEKAYSILTEKWKGINTSLNYDLDPEAEEQGYLDGQRALSGRYITDGKEGE